MVNLSFSTNAFRNHSLEEAAKAISAAGYSGIEIMCDTPHAYPDHLSDGDVEGINTLMKREGLVISNLNAFMMCAVKNFHHPSWIEEDKDFREIRIQYTLRCIDLAEKLGVKTISTEPGGPLNGMPRNIAEEMFMEGLARVVPYAVEKDVVVLIEPEPDLLIETSEEFLSFINKFDSKGIGLNFDVGHFYCVNEDPVEIINKLSTYIYHFHLEDIPANKEHKHIMLGEGGIDIPGVIKAINKLNYEGFVTIELYPYLDSAPQTASKAMHYLRGICE